MRSLARVECRGTALRNASAIADLPVTSLTVAWLGETAPLDDQAVLARLRGAIDAITAASVGASGADAAAFASAIATLPASP